MANEHEGDDVSPSVKKERKEKEEGEGWEEEEGAKEVPEFAKRCDGMRWAKVWKVGQKSKDSKIRKIFGRFLCLDVGFVYPAFSM